MALNSDTDSPANGAVNLPEMESGAGDDLEDGEIFDDDEPVEVFKGGGFEEKPLAPETPPREQSFKNKGNSGGGDRKKGQKDEEKRSNSNERRGDKRGDRGNNRNNTGGCKRKRGRDSEDDHRTPNKTKQRKRNEKNKLTPLLEEEVDENEMVYVMGGNSPTAPKQPPDWEMFSDEEEPERERENERGVGGRGGRRGREGFHTSGRMSRRSRLGRGGAKRNRFSRKQNNDLTICKFFMQGKCQRGNDCPFSHTALPSKKMELCKFYMNDCCTKRDKCLYMHGDFPCKFYHTGQKCYAGKRCKFYHGKISNFLRSVLMKHLDNRELQKEFDKYSELYEKKDRDRGRDRDRFSSDRRRSRSDEEEGGGGGSTPMPSPQRDEFTSDGRERSPTPEREREKRERRKRRAKRRSREEEEKRDYYGEDAEYYGEDCHGQGQADNEYHWGDGGDHQQYNYPDQNYPDNNDYTNDDYPDEEQEMNPLPANLPKTQRKLFMRIQQQQQQHSKQSDDRPMEDDGKEEEFKEEDWRYSSDEEGANNPLNTIFRNVPGLQMNNNPMQQQQHMNNPMPPPNPMMNAPMPPNSMMNNPMMNQCPPMNPPPMPLMPPMMPPHPQQPPMAPMNNAMFDSIDLSTVSKILITVRESIQKKNSSEPGSVGGLPPGMRTPESGPGPSDSPKSSHTAQEERRFRDPRLRAQEGGNERSKVQPSAAPVKALLHPTQPVPVLLTQADLDLRLSDPPPTQAQISAGSDVDLRHLPFKPAPLHQAANEIDASTSSGPPMEWKLNTLRPLKPDYASIASRSNPQTCANDPRLRKYATPQVLAQSQMVVAQALPSGQTRMLSPPSGSHGLSPPQNNQMVRNEEAQVVSRDPRNRGGVANDPRRRNQPVVNASLQNPQQQQQMYSSQAFNMMRPPFTPNQQFNPQFDPQQPRQDNDFRVGLLPQMPQLSPLVMPNMSDVDLRIQQPHYYQ